MDSFVTLQRGDINFQNHMLGDVGGGMWALPVQTLRVSSDKVTFRVVSKSVFERPNLFVILAQLLRWELLSLTLGPAMIIYVPAFMNRTISPVDFLFAVASLFF